jgi:hypothetical protein
MGPSQREARLGRCQDLNAALQGGSLISIKALASRAAQTAPGYIHEFVRIHQGREPEVGICLGFRIQGLGVITHAIHRPSCKVNCLCIQSCIVLQSNYPGDLWADIPSLPCPSHLLRFCSGTSGMAHAFRTKCLAAVPVSTLCPSSDINVKRVAIRNV